MSGNAKRRMEARATRNGQLHRVGPIPTEPNPDSPASSEPFPPNSKVATVIGWSRDIPTDIEEAKQRTHDELINVTGEHRTTGVRWYLVRGAEARAAIDEAMGTLAPDNEVGRNYYRRLSAHVREYAGVIVIAACLAE